jgi:hypothetical protein
MSTSHFATTIAAAAFALATLVGSTSAQSTQTPQDEGRCLSASSLDDLFVVPPGFQEIVDEGAVRTGSSQRVFHHDDGRQVIEQITQTASPSEAIRQAARVQAGLSDDTARAAVVAVPCGTRTLTVIASGATRAPEQNGPHPNAGLALETITNMIG